jgi:chromate transporter
MTQHRVLDIALVFVPLSFATIGGGQGALSGIRNEVIAVHHWMTPQQFVDAFAISRMAPGPGSLIVTLIGWQVDGLIGAIVATLAIFGPTSLLVYGVARLWSRHPGARWQIALEQGLRPVAAGLILAAVYVLIVDMAGGWPTRLIAALSTTVLLKSRIPPLLLIAGGVLLCLGFYELDLLPVS